VMSMRRTYLSPLMLTPPLHGGGFLLFKLAQHHADSVAIQRTE